MNIQKLRQVGAFIRQYPDNFDIAEWANGILVADKQTAPSCGTVACIAGWAVALEDGFFDGTQPDSKAGILERASLVLDITSEQAKTLFYCSAWPTHFRLAYSRAYAAGVKSRMARVANARIEYLIETGL